MEGEGKPPPERSEQTLASTADAVGFRMMVEASVVPEEITLRKQTKAHRHHLATLRPRLHAGPGWPSWPNLKCATGSRWKRGKS
ncbi:DUF1992 domain-containing protein [Roseovarius pelagicus]|uniref:DUF1992 domain-containing protein n=1 Tax=Roseovarius pelagicus TaxID=2980108 RepID=A0ABY6DGE7_9RHOB|nr:DUF1992 domain-containing protein [Roseovarius pelagicus]